MTKDMRNILIELVAESLT